METQPYSGDTGLFEGYKVLSQKTLNYFDIKANSNKFYTIEIHSGKGDIFRIFTSYGRVGSKGRQEERLFNLLWQTESEARKIIRSKEQKGYVEVDLAQSKTGSEKSKEFIDIDKVVVIDEKIKENEEKCTLDKRVQEFVKQIYFEAEYKLNMLVRGNQKNTGDSPLGKLSSAQIQKGRDVLQKIANIIANVNFDLSDPNTEDTLINYCNEYYRYIPKVFGCRVDIPDILLSNMWKITMQNEILDFYEASLKMDNVIYNTENIDKQYKELHCDIVPLEKDDEEYLRIVKKVKDTESKKHNVHLSIKNIFSVNQLNSVAFDDSCGNVQELFHGTRSANIPSVLSTHLKMPNKLNGVQITGAMFGPGLYFANQSTKSSQYSCARFGGTTNKSKTSFMFLADVSLGKVKDENNASYYYNAPKGYNSVKGCKGNYLLHDEFVIYNENQQKLRYIIEFATYKD